MGCTKAREFLAQKQDEVEERDLFKEPLSLPELKALAKRMGGVRELVAPKSKKELEGLSDAEVLQRLAENPRFVRRPIIDTGDLVVGGFSAETKKRLEGESE